ncbi:MAG: tRNA glutamyl-Q(34) synthetase GluQRS [Myxococcota bacterium]
MTRPERTSSRRGRYAPSPTGPLHLGNVRTALLSWLHMRVLGGGFVLRMEDIDEGRVVEGSAAQILEDLRWLGLDWDEGPDVGGPHAPYTQTQRKPIYEEAMRRLRAAGLVYPCYCSRRDIREAAGVTSGFAVYPGTCRELTDGERAARGASRGLEPVWRFRVGERVVRVEDGLCGAQTQELAREVGDIKIKRRDGLFAYQLVVVVDDALMGITDVMRGADLLDSTPRQLALFEALGYDAPAFWHVPLVRAPSGEKLSKRDGSRSMAALREDGWKPSRVVGHLAASVGLVDEGAQLSARELSEEVASRYGEAWLDKIRRTS